MKKCERCFGIKRKLVDITFPWGSAPWFTEKPCPVCHGEGEVPVDTEDAG